VRVLVWVHKESCEVLAATLQSLLAADLPYSTTRMVYVCDDSCDPEKEYICANLGPEVVYVGGRKKVKGACARGSGRPGSVVYPWQMRGAGCLHWVQLAPLLSLLLTAAPARPGEMNAKACALNHCLKQLYPRKMAAPPSEVVLVLDAHMSPVRQLFCKLLEVMQVGGAAGGLAARPWSCLAAAGCTKRPRSSAALAASHASPQLPRAPLLAAC
jgi:hypothetical protein